MLRYRLAPAWLLAHRTVRMLSPAAAGDRFRILLLHDVPRAAMRGLERLLAHIAAGGGFITPEQAEAHLDGRRPLPPYRGGGPAPTLITFDDGFASNYDVAQMLLAKYEARALFFVCPDLVALEGGAQRAAIAAHIFDGRVGADALPPQQRLMTWDELRSLAAAGHSIGAHGRRHLRLSALPQAALEDEIAGSGDAIEDALGRPVGWYAFSFGTIASISPEALAVIGRRFRFCRSGVRGDNRAGTHRLALRADQVDLEAPDAWQRLVLEGGLDARYGDARRRLDAWARRAVSASEQEKLA